MGRLRETRTRTARSSRPRLPTPKEKARPPIRSKSYSKVPRFDRPPPIGITSPRAPRARPEGHDTKGSCSFVRLYFARSLDGHRRRD